MTAHRADRADLIVETIDDFTDEYGHPPSIRQLMARVGLSSTAAVHFHLRKLVKAGRLAECSCGCGAYGLAYQDPSGPGVAYITGDDTPESVERKMAEAFAPVTGILDAFARYMGDDS